MSTKFQVTFPDPLMARLKRESRRLDLPVAEFVRRSAEAALGARTGADSKGDPFASITGIVPSLATDLAGRVDEIYD